jgi:hypothetical protein
MVTCQVLVENQVGVPAPLAFLDSWHARQVPYMVTDAIPVAWQLEMVVPHLFALCYNKVRDRPYDALVVLSSLEDKANDGQSFY